MYIHMRHCAYWQSALDWPALCTSAHGANSMSERGSRILTCWEYWRGRYQDFVSRLICRYKFWTCSPALTHRTSPLESLRRGPLGGGTGQVIAPQDTSPAVPEQLCIRYHWPSVLPKEMLLVCCYTMWACLSHTKSCCLTKHKKSMCYPGVVTLACCTEAARLSCLVLMASPKVVMAR